MTEIYSIDSNFLNYQHVLRKHNLDRGWYFRMDGWDQGEQIGPFQSFAEAEIAAEEAEDHEIEIQRDAYEQWRAECRGHGPTFPEYLVEYTS